MPKAPRTFDTVSKRGFVLGFSALYKASLVIPLVFEISAIPFALAICPKAVANSASTGGRFAIAISPAPNSVL